MLMNYDAKAIAEVMGVAFPTGRAPGSSSPTPKMAEGSKSAAGSTTGENLAAFEPGRRALAGPVIVLHVGVPDDGVDLSVTSQHNIDRFRIPSSILIETAVKNGLPRQALRRVAERLAGGDAAKIPALEWIVVPKTTLERREERLSPQESERTERVARLFVHALRALGSEAEAREFMTTPHPQLDGRSPIDAAKTDLGTRHAEHILNALEYGLAL